MTAATSIVTIDDTNFKTEVLEKSHDVPVLVDFWAEWCSPCQMLLPILSDLATEYQGQFILAKVNSDEFSDLAREYKVRSLPTLKLFRYGEVVEEIVGAQPEQLFRQLIDKYIKRTSDSLRPQALVLSDGGEHEGAIALLNKALQLEPEHLPIKVDLMRVFINAKDYDAAEALFKALPANIQVNDEFGALATELNYAQQLKDAPTQDDLEAKVLADPDNLDYLYQLALRQMQTQMYTLAMDNFLALMRKDRKFKDDAGRKGMLAVFELLPIGDPLLSRYRSQLSSFLY